MTFMLSMYYNINMGQPQESRPESGKNEAPKADVIRGLLRKGTLVIAGLLGAGGAAGCSGAKPEAPSPLDVRVTMVAPEKAARPLEGEMGGEAKKGEKTEEKKEDAEHWKEVRLSVIGDHVLSDGKYYLKTIEVEGKKSVAVWELLEGDTPSAMKAPSRVTARIDEKDGRLDFDGHIYFMARDPGAWERGREEAARTRAGTMTKKDAASFPVPEKKIAEETVPYAAHGMKMQGVAFEAYAVSNALAEMQADGTLKIIAGKEVRIWKLVRGSPPLRPTPIGFVVPATFIVVRTPSGIRLELPGSGPLVRMNPRLQVPAATYWEEVR